MSLARVIIGAVLVFTFSDAIASGQQRLTEQADIMPEDFKRYLFNTPLSSNIILDGRMLGDAMIMLTEDNQVRIIHFTDSGHGEYDAATRQHWLQAFSELVPLGQCGKHCPPGLLAVDYNLSEASLVLISARGNQPNDYWYGLPEGGDLGVLVNNQLNTSASREQSMMSWNGGLDAALGDWTVSSQFQRDETRSRGQSTSSRHAVTSLYAQREFQQSFLRAGLFMPDSQGLLRQPYMPGGGISTLAGVMMGSSDARLKARDIPAVYPVYVTANREGVAEVYRNGALIHSQPVAPGLQLLDTVPLPSGIYDVEIRIVEDGRETSRTKETINKPTAWRNPGQRVRYNLFAGQQKTLWSSDSQENEQQLAAGVSLNYLLLPQTVLGIAAQKVGKERQLGGTLDWQVAEPVQLYGNLWRSNVTGYGFDSQGIWNFQQGNITLSHSRSWYRPYDDPYGYIERPLTEYTTAFSATWRIDSEKSLNARLSQSSRHSTPGIDAGFNLRTFLQGHSINWRLAGFDRPYSDTSSLRNRGITLSASFALGTDQRSGNVSLGSRSDSRGARDLYASAAVSQEWGANSPVKSTTATLTSDRYGLGLSAYNQFDMPFAQGNFWGQRSSQDGQLSGGLNVGSLLAMKGNTAVVAKTPGYIQGGGVIVDVKSDDPNVQLVALASGSTTPLHPGRNFIPVEAWKPGSIQLDFAGKEAPALKIEPEYLSYQHIPGGVSHYRVRAVKTVTVMGRLTDSHGLALGGAHIKNHASQTMTEPDGLFTLEMQESHPVLMIEPREGAQCEIHLDPASQKREEVLFVGNLVCGREIQTVRASASATGMEKENI